MLTVKKKVIFLSCLGVIPFYSNLLIIFINNFYNLKLFEQINLVSFFYGALISSFLCGMQWIKFIDKKKKLFIYSNDSSHITLGFVFFFRKNFFSINCYHKPILVPNCRYFNFKKRK